MPDFERAWFQLKAHVATKRSHGADELKVKMHDLEVEMADLEIAAASEVRTSDRPATAAHA